jgi:hypothetical protein
VTPVTTVTRGERGSGGGCEVRAVLPVTSRVKRPVTPAVTSRDGVTGVGCDTTDETGDR